MESANCRVLVSFLFVVRVETLQSIRAEVSAKSCLVLLSGSIALLPSLIHLSG